MCDFRKIIFRQTGYVAQCSFCHSIEIVFGTSVIHIGFLDWASFNKYISGVRYDCNRPDSGDIRNIMLQLGGNSPLQMFLTANELQDFCDLIDQADSEIRAKHLIGLFSGE
ncbi:MAG: hypothetical protein BGP14_16950 [Sphingobacteriales bacterium 44-15]|nr:MAG: hypothetical protein BGP14_16950 [Sphingobacteriales bacterium 44-15]